MSAPSQRNDGMGSLLYPDGTARFRVWAPHAARVELVLDHPTRVQSSTSGPLGCTWL
jgi:1,4-alpha-glucan branching enzyme